MTKENNGKFYKLFLWSLSCSCVIAAVFHGPQAGRDTLDYLAGTIIRPPLPCLLFDLFRLVFGGKYAAWYLLFQTAAVLCAAGYFTGALRKTARIGNGWAATVFAIAISPLLNGWISCQLQTEAVSYSLFLVSFALLAQLLEIFDAKKLALLAGVVVLNMLNRPQMLFVYAIYALAAVYLLIRHTEVRQAALAVIIFVTAPLLCYLAAECGYNLLRHGSFARSDFPGQTQIAASLLYVSDKEDLNLFRDKPYYHAMERIYAELDEYKLFASYRHEMDMNYAAYWDSGIRPTGIYNATSSRADILYWHTLVRNLYMQKSGTDISRKDWMAATCIDYADNGKWIAIRGMGMDISRTLFKHHWTDYLKLVGSKLKNHLPPYALVLVFLLLALPCLRSGHTAEFINMSALAALLNLLLMSSCTSILPRLAFYTDILIFECCLLLVFELYKAGHAHTA